ncbi:UDP-D-xylose:L-fucose alpha-1,3-D-xylosyltransferase-like [Strongylocentrotus purpuratus]|uniref:Nucleotide-diphospho-sugar transferase domain-containing protein n=1 Tax=Strongylocentrotus purpuratus TaxID=7668 RepID=A0A7M7P4V2_STRPU|nr:UDP-D-xylose:L-fucose alpha-1,3-D-xylosyltransferase-like [Strongylocentrotus purpuratus]
MCRNDDDNFLDLYTQYDMNARLMENIRSRGISAANQTKMRRNTLRVGIKVVFLLSFAVLSFYLGWHAVPRSVAKKERAIPYKAPAASPTAALSNNGRLPLQINACRENSTIRKPIPTHSRPRPRPRIILATTNKAFLDFTENWIESLKRCNVRDHVTIIAEDPSTYEILAKRNDINLELLLTSKTNLPDSDLAFGSQDYLRLVNKRPNYILRYLQRGTDVLFSDVDTVWLKNPLPFFEDGYDLYFGRDIYDDQTKPDLVCAGFVYYRATKATIDLIVKWIQRIHARPEIPDQQLLNHLLRNRTIRNTLKLKYLDQRQFPNGNDYFNVEWREKHANIEPIVVHNNWIKGHDIKIERFKNASMWYL